MADEVVYVPGKGLVPLAEAQQIATQLQQSKAPLFVGKPGADVSLNAGSPEGNREMSAMIESDLANGIPQLAGLANLHPALRGAKAMFAVPAMAEGARQFLQGEEFDPGSIAQQGLIGNVIGMAGNAFKLPSRIGRTMITKAIGQGLGPEASEQMTNTAVREGASLTSEGIKSLVKKSVELENQALALAQQGNAKGAAALRSRVAQLDSLIQRLKTTPPVTGGSSLPHVSARGSGFTLGLPQINPRAALEIGQGLTTGESFIPQVIEGLMRLVGADLSIPEPEAETAPVRRRGATGP